MHPALRRIYYYSQGGGALPEILLSDEFTGTVIDTEKWTVTNTNSSDLLISQDDKLLFTRVTDNAVGTALTNCLQSFQTFEMGSVVSVRIFKEIGFANSIFFFRLTFNGTTDYVSIQNSSGSPGRARLIIQKGGSTNEYDFETGIATNNLFKIVTTVDNEFSFFFWGAGEWVKMGATQAVVFTGSFKVHIGATSNALDAIGDQVSFDAVRVAANDYSTELPEGNNVMSGVTQLFYDGEGELAAFNPITPFFTFQMVKNTVDGKYYFTGMGMEANNRDPYVFRYNRATNSVEQTHRIEVGVVTSDTHRKAAIDFGDDGSIYVVFERLASPFTHGTELYLYKTTTPGDLSTLTLLKTITGCYTYPTIKVDGDNILISARGTTLTDTFIRSEYVIHVSTDGGANFTTRTIYDSGDEQKVAYCFKVFAYNGEIHIILNERDNDLFSYTFVAHLKSADLGVTWTNQAGTFSKDVGSSGAVTRAEMVANCLIYESPTPSTVQVSFEGGIVKSDGTVKILISVQSITGVEHVGNQETEYDELRFYTYSSGWSYNSVDIPEGLICFPAYERPVQYINSDESFDDILLADFTDSHSTFILRSSDNFATQTSRKIVNGNNRYAVGAVTQNAETEHDYIIIMRDPRGNFLIIEDEDPDDYSDLLIVHP